MIFGAAQLPVLRALLDAIIPADDFPSAWEAGVHAYLEKLLAEREADAELVLRGLSSLQAEAAARGPTPFEELDPVAREALLLDVEAGRVRGDWQADPRAFFARMVELCAEGYYGDPQNGGNRHAVSWKMLGFDPGLP